MDAILAMHRDALIDRVGAAEDVRGVFAAASEGMRRLVPRDAAVWLASDPATSLPTAPTRSENMGFVGGSDGCLRLWELEFLVEDVNLYRDVERAETPAGGLHRATGDRPARSARYREFLRPNGLDDELRAAMRVDGTPGGGSRSAASRAGRRSGTRRSRWSRAWPRRWGRRCESRRGARPIRARTTAAVPG
jgi:hypothetical protein